MKIQGIGARVTDFWKAVERSKAGAFLDHFSKVPVIGVDPGSAVVKMAQVEEAQGKFILRRARLAKIENEDAASALKKLRHGSGFETTNAAVGLASPEVIVRTIQFPTMPQKELTGALHVEAEHATLNGHLPSEMTFDWHRLEGLETGIRGLLAVVPKEIIAHQVKVIHAAGLHARVVDVQGLALWNAYWSLRGKREKKSNTLLLMNIGARTTNLVIAQGPDRLMLVRDLETGQDAFAEGRPFEWTEEIQDSLAYARAKSGLRGLEEIILTGGGSSHEVARSLKSLLGLPVALWNPLDDISWEPASCGISDASVGPLFAVAIGLAMRKA